MIVRVQDNCLVDIETAAGKHAAAVCLHERRAIGQVVFTLLVSRLDARQRVEQCSAIERETSGVDLADGPLLRSGILVLDDRQKLTRL